MPIVIVIISRAIGVYGGSGLLGICYNNLKKTEHNDEENAVNRSKRS